MKTTQLNERQIARWSRDWMAEGATNNFLVQEPVEEPEPHEHDFKRVPKGERTDRLRFVCAQYKCYECGETYYM